MSRVNGRMYKPLNPRQAGCSKSLLLTPFSRRQNGRFEVNKVKRVKISKILILIRIKCVTISTNMPKLGPPVPKIIYDILLNCIFKLSRRALSTVH